MRVENKNAVYNILGTVCLNGIQFFSIPIFTRVLGPEQYGIVSVYTTWVSIFSIIFGLQVQGSIGTAIARLEKKEIKGYLSTILITGLLFSFFCLLIFLLFSEVISKLLLMSHTVLYLMVIQSIGTFVIAFSGIAFVFYKKAKNSFMINVTTAISTTVLSLLLSLYYFQPEIRYLGKMYGMVIPIILIATGITVYFIKENWRCFNFNYIKFCLPLSIPLIFHGLSQIILSHSDRIMLQHMLGNEETGIYSFMISFSGVLIAIYGALNNTWVPFYYDDLKAKALDKIDARTKNYIFIYSIIVIVFSLWAPEVIKIFVPPSFWIAIDLLPFFVLGNYFNFLYSFPVNFEFFHKTTYTVAIGTIGAAVINIAANYILIPYMGILGAALATFLSYILLFAFHEVIATYILPYNYHYSMKNFWLGIVAVVTCVMGASILKEFILIRWSIGLLLVCIWFYSIYQRRSLF